MGTYYAGTSNGVQLGSTSASNYLYCRTVVSCTNEEVDNMTWTVQLQVKMTGSNTRNYYNYSCAKITKNGGTATQLWNWHDYGYDHANSQYDHQHGVATANAVEGSNAISANTWVNWPINNNGTYSGTAVRAGENSAPNVGGTVNKATSGTFTANPGDSLSLTVWFGNSQNAPGFNQSYTWTYTIPDAGKQWVWVNGAWRKATPWVWVNGGWRKIKNSYVWVNGNWRKTKP